MDRGPVFPGGTRPPGARNDARPSAPLRSRMDFVFVVAIEEECEPVFLNSGRALDRMKRGERPERVPSRGLGEAPRISLFGVGFHWGSTVSLRL